VVAAGGGRGEWRTAQSINYIGWNIYQALRGMGGEEQEAA